MLKNRIFILVLINYLNFSNCQWFGRTGEDHTGKPLKLSDPCSKSDTTLSHAIFWKNISGALNVTELTNKNFNEFANSRSLVLFYNSSCNLPEIEKQGIAKLATVLKGYDYPGSNVGSFLCTGAKDQHKECKNLSKCPKRAPFYYFYGQNMIELYPFKISANQLYEAVRFMLEHIAFPSYQVYPKNRCN